MNVAHLQIFVAFQSLTDLFEEYLFAGGIKGWTTYNGKGNKKEN